MDIKILDSWLREFLETKAKPTDLAKYLSLCGPSAERIEKFGTDFVYNIEVTTNRIDTASVYGIAREASAILPRFKVAAKLKHVKLSSNEYKFVNEVGYLNPTVDPKLCSRFCAVLIKNVKIGDSPDIIKARLESAGVRALNNIVDISNYIMLELGQPVHTFDYDKIKDHKMILRESKKGEVITTLDSKEFKLNGGDIVIEDGEGRLIDLAGVMGGNLSAVDDNTKNVLLFVQTYDPVRIRKTSMSLAQRTLAATIFEKGTDTELVTPAILKGIELFKTLCRGTPEHEIIDLYPSPFKSRKITLDLDFIEKRLGITISKNAITNYLSSLEFEASWNGNKLSVNVPSFRSRDVLAAEDVVEEIARIYGYHNLPSELMTGKLTGRSSSPEFAFEDKIKNHLAGWGGSEVYTLSLVSKGMASSDALKLKNPLGIESEYLRTSLMPSLVTAATGNLGTIEDFHIFEVANVYLPHKNDLPEERLMLAGIFSGYEYPYRNAKGVIEALFEKLHIPIIFESRDSKGFEASKCALISTGNEIVGKIGYAEGTNLIYYELDLKKIFKLTPKTIRFQEISKYPAQQEDITFILPERTKIGDVAKLILSTSMVRGCSVGNPYNGNNYTFHIWYQDPNKTLTDLEVEKIRTKILQTIKEKFGGQIKN